MAKKKDEVKWSKKSFDYMKIVDEMNEEAFEFCVEHLYPLYNYRILKQEDIRRIDLKENLLRLESLIPNDLKSIGTFNYYIYMVQLYLDSIIPCKEKSRAESYKKRTCEAIELAFAEDGGIEDVDDVFFGFMALLRTIRAYINNDKNYVVIFPSFKIEEDDVDILKELYSSKKRTPEGIDGKKGFIDKKLSLEFEKLNARKFFFINSVIFLSRALQSFGAFNTEE